MKRTFFLLFIASALVVGCDLANPTPRKEGPAEPPPVEAEPKPETKPEPAPESETVAIERGFTGKGQYGQDGGEKPSDMITVPVGELFAVRERMFLLQLKHAEDIFKGNNDNQMPKTQEEYMEKIVGENMLKLPELPSGQEYVYDPEDGQLKIKKAR